MNNQGHLVLDVGGTKTVVGCIDHNQKVLLWYDSVKTESGYHEFPKFIGKVLKEAILKAHEGRILLNSVVGMGLPGNFDSGAKFNLKKGSGRQLIKKNEKIEGVLDNKWISSQFPDDFNVWAVNDAVAQAVGGILQTWSDAYQHKLFLYIGPGTGLGGAVIASGSTVDDLVPITDGHIYDVMVEGGDSDEWMAENLISGRAVMEKCDVSAKEVNDCDEYWNIHQPHVMKMGDGMVRLIETLRSGKFKKNHPENNWTVEEQEMMRSIDGIILGGSLGTQGRFGALLQSIVKESLDIPLIPMRNPTEAALLGVRYLQDKDVKD